MSAYTGLADRYDGLTGDVAYSQWFRWYQSQFRREKQPVEQVLDLACGTGTLTCLLAQAGYRMIGVDASEEMLAQAMDKCLEAELDPMPLLLCQAMESLQLIEPVDACVCSLDSLNYLTRRRKLAGALERVGRFLRPGGLFLFDVIPPWEFARRDGEVYLDETEDTLCLWRASYHRKTQEITYGVDLFCRQKGDLWTREQEEHRERGWDLDLLRQMLEQAGFAGVACYGEDKRTPPDQKDRRVFFCCRKAERGPEESSGLSLEEME